MEKDYIVNCRVSKFFRKKISASGPDEAKKVLLESVEQGKEDPTDIEVLVTAQEFRVDSPPRAARMRPS